ncbi:TetR family transcriptional regulator [Arthrobacter sp. PAMC25564]|uniref:TetR/AcrR family transcriptional regulator n=1 Tax=Arthrobacter sp. PAMC25564 TaxID=2565366 RepID=UPI0010A21842|nr:TetR family transcriptional regulator C-terminal domain-containing protein [Arthrobacter sp. PAMC25564]QCB96848.1 TetR family transcriptional regulator [Arthrobacter sp. PAMC25564]
MPKFVDAALRRQDVVEAAFRIIAADGLERVSLREVADEASLAVGSVRHYFASSDELLVHSFRVVVDRVIGRLSAADARLAGLVPGTAGHHHGVLALLGEFLPLDEARAVDACVWMAFKNAARIRPVLAAEADRSHRGVAAIVGRVVMDLGARGAAPDQQKLVIEAERLLATLDGLTMHALLQPEWMTAQMCRDVLDAHLAGLDSSGASPARSNAASH